MHEAPKRRLDGPRSVFVPWKILDPKVTGERKREVLATIEATKARLAVGQKLNDLKVLGFVIPVDKTKLLMGILATLIP